MPTRNVVKIYASNSYYHIYTRGVNKQDIFKDGADMAYFLSLLKRYLSPEQQNRKKHAPYKSFHGQLVLSAYCLMDNHIHLLIYQAHDETVMVQFMRRVMTSYSIYFNHKYSRVGPLFQSRYLASRISDDSYLHHISRYIHKNPSHWKHYAFSSLRYYLGLAASDWIHPSPIMELFDYDTSKYLAFMLDDNDNHDGTAELLAHE